MRVVVLILIGAIAGCSSGRNEATISLRNATSFELLSLDPSPRKNDDRSETFHNWTVLGIVTVSNPAIRTELIDAMEAGIAENDGTVAACFEPRHGVRFKHDGSQHDLVICFHCYSARWYVAGVQNEGFLLTGSPQTVFDRVLTLGSVSLAPSATD